MNQTRHDSSNAPKTRFRRDGLLAPVHIMDSAETATYQGPTVDDVDGSLAVACTLHPGEASFHHGWTLHSSAPNVGNHRRIGFNAQYMATHVRQTQHTRDTAMLVCGVDTFHYFGVDVPAPADLDPQTLARQRELDRQVRATMGEKSGHP